MGVREAKVVAVRTPTPHVVESGGAVHVLLNDPCGDLDLRFTSVGDCLVVANALIDAARTLRRVEIESRTGWLGGADDGIG